MKTNYLTVILTKRELHFNRLIDTYTKYLLTNTSRSAVRCAMVIVIINYKNHVPYHVFYFSHGNNQ